MKLSQTICLITMCAALTGCLTTKYGEEQPLSIDQKKDFLDNSVYPQSYGLRIVRVPNGITYQGAARVHPLHMATLDLKERYIPVVAVKGMQNKMKANALLDISSPYSWIEAGTALEMRARVLGINGMHIPYRGAVSTGGIDAYAGIIGRLRFKQFYVENTPIFIRMAEGSLGPLARGVSEPDVHMVLGYDAIRTFEFIQYDLVSGKIRLSATTEYEPVESRLISTCRLSPNWQYGCAVEGAIYGESTPIVIDPVGDFTFARSDSHDTVTKQVSVGDVVVRNVPTINIQIPDALPRLGRRVMLDYLVTVCPQKGLVYFERPTDHLKDEDQDEDKKEEKGDKEKLDSGFEMKREASIPKEKRTIQMVR